MMAGSPQLVNCLDAPAGAVCRDSDWFLSDDDVDRVGVKLWEVTDGDPAALSDLDRELQIVSFPVGRNFFGRDDVAVDDDLDQTAATRDVVL